MGLNVAVFVPEGIVIASDSMAFVRSEDEGFISSSERTFTCMNRFAVSFIGNGYVNDMPYGYILNSFLASYVDEDISTIGFTDKLKEFVSQFKTEEPLCIYVAGIDLIENKVVPFLYLIDKGETVRLNAPTEQDSSQLFYNYHSIGQSLWINKLFLPTKFDDSNKETSEEFAGANIDFRRFSIEQAKSFALFLIETSANMEKISQMRPTINETITLATVLPFTSPQIINKTD